MQLQEEKIVVDRSQSFVEESFGIGDLRIVLGILRDKLYSDPIKSLVQEVISNAKDANYEAGNAKTPLTINIPTKQNLVFFVEDNGIGIDPERMSGIFIQYGASTKRSDSNQSGGFGIGAKSPFAYTDMFSIETTTCKADVLTTRNYIAYIDESQIGKLTLVSEIAGAKTKTGTKIEIAVKPEDCYSFQDAVFDVTRYFSVLPEFNELDCDFQRPVTLFENEHLMVLKGQSMILVNEIPYRINTRKLEIGSGKFSQFGYIFKFGTDIKVAANREDLDYSNSSVEMLIDKTNNAIETWKVALQKDLDSFQTLKEVIYHVNSLPTELRNLYNTGLFTFQGNQFRSYSDLMGAGNCSLVNGTRLSDLGHRLYFYPGMKIVIDDLLYDGHQDKRLLTVVNREDSKDKAITLISPHKHIVEVGRKKVYTGYFPNYINWFIQNHDLLQLFGFSYLSTYEPFKAPREIKPKADANSLRGIKTITPDHLFTECNPTILNGEYTLVWFDFKVGKAIYNEEEMSKVDTNQIIRFITRWYKELFKKDNLRFLFVGARQVKNVPTLAVKAEDYVKYLTSVIKANAEIMEAMAFNSCKENETPCVVGAFSWRDNVSEFLAHPYFAELVEFKEVRKRAGRYEFDDTFYSLTGIPKTSLKHKLVDIVVEKMEKIDYLNMRYIPFEVFDKIINLL